MSYAHYERLTALDAAFLEIEDAAVHMHVGAAGIFAGGPLMDERGTLDIERVEAIVDGRWTPTPEERQAIALSLGVPVDEIAFGHNMNARNIRFRRFGFKEDF